MSSASPERPRSLKRLSQKRTVAPHRPSLAAIPGALRPSTACWMICARRTSPAPSFCERVIRASLCPSSSLKARTRRVIATSPAQTATPCNAPDLEKSHLTCRMHHLMTLSRKSGPDRLCPDRGFVHLEPEMREGIANRIGDCRWWRYRAPFAHALDAERVK